MPRPAPRTIAALALACCLGGTERLALAQSSPAGTPNPSSSTRRAQAPSVPLPTPFARALSRWLDLQAASVAVRYRFIEATTGAPDVSQVQGNQVLRLRFKADPRGLVCVVAGLSSGANFTGSWNDTGIGTGERTLDVNVRHLYADVTPVRGTNVQFGSFGIARGESTEITTYDNDGYLTGTRVSVRRPAELFVDEIAATWAYLGDTRTPSLFDRADRFDESNYQQYLLARRAGPRLTLSADFTRLERVSTTRFAVRARLPELQAADTVRYEQYVRTTGDAAAGFAVTADKQVARPVGLSYGYAHIDRDHGTLNGDRFGRGHRVFGSATWQVAPAWSITTWAGRAVATDYPIPNRARIDVVLTYNVLKDLQRHGLVR